MTALPKRLWIGATATLFILAVAIFLLWYSIIPYKSYDTRTFLEQKGFKTIPTDSQIQRMIARAKLDYFLSPMPTGRDRLLFVRAKDNGQILYLFFKPASISNTAIAYAYDAVSREPLWKTEVGTDDD